MSLIHIQNPNPNPRRAIYPPNFKNSISMETTSTSSQPTVATAPPSSSTSSTNPNTNPSQNPNQNPKPSTTLQPHRPPFPHFQIEPPLQPTSSQFSSRLSSLSSQPSSTSFSSYFSSSAFPSDSATPMQSSGFAIGVPAHEVRQPGQGSSISSLGKWSFNRKSDESDWKPVIVTKSTEKFKYTEAMESIQGTHTIGMSGSLSGLMQQNEILRSNNQSPATQKFQSDGLLRVPSTDPPSYPATGAPQGLEPHTQPWLSATYQRERIQRLHYPWQRNLPAASHQQRPSTHRQQEEPQSLEQRLYYARQHHLPAASHQQMPYAQQQQKRLGSFEQSSHYVRQHHLPAASHQQMPSAQQQQKRPESLGQSSHYTWQHHLPEASHQQMPSAQQQQKTPKSLKQSAHYARQHILPAASHQQMPSAQQQQKRPESLGQSSHYTRQHHLPEASHQQMPSAQQQQKPLSQEHQYNKSPKLVAAQSTIVQSGPNSTTASIEAGESSNCVVNKARIHRLANEIDPYVKLDPEVVDILVELGNHFVDSVSTGACLLAKHRKSNILEPKDILLHLKKNWNITLPEFDENEITSYEKPVADDIHEERLAVIDESIVETEVVNTEISAGEAAGSTEDNAVQSPATGYPKTHEMP